MASINPKCKVKYACCIKGVLSASYHVIIFFAYNAEIVRKLQFQINGIVYNRVNSELYVVNINTTKNML